MREHATDRRAERLEILLPDALRRHGIDAWLVVTREYSSDPLAADVGLGHVVGKAAGLFVLDGDRLRKTAVVAAYDTTPVEEAALYDRIVSYRSEGLGPRLREVLDAAAPERIGIDVSETSPLADGLSAGLRRYLDTALGEAAERLVSAEEVVADFRSRRLPEEIEVFREAIETTEEIFRLAFSAAVVRPGETTERQVAAAMKARMAELGHEPSWRPDHCPNVWTEARGHGGPTDRVVERGDLLSIDFGIAVEGLRTDLQRTAYVLREGEAGPPETILELWETAVAANRAAVAAMRPGVTGLQVDRAAREVVEAGGYEPYSHATGHPLGYATHEIGPLLGPDWPEVYGDAVRRTLVAGQLFAVEPSVAVEHEGRRLQTGLEEDVLVTEEGAEVLSRAQEDLFLLG